ncbi:hypothetical protein [Novosphingobium sp.]|uniref:hypothetical protein n=1 Tax=Novosphingobium sp. TaxID=1874826 RepID=UPI0028AB103C|nr:hypothetical protein [Novosphingobium sp.]
MKLAQTKASAGKFRLPAGHWEVPEVLSAGASWARPIKSGCIFKAVDPIASKQLL